MSVVSLDFETRSTVDLRNTGVYPYAKHTSTGIWCMAYAFDDEEPEIWSLGDPFPQRLEMHIVQGGILRAWNAQFERVMWRDCAVPKFGFPHVADEQWHCTAAEAAAMALPRSLDQCASVTGVQQQKDVQGYQLMLRMCRPRNVGADGTITWWDVPERRRRLEKYCMQDVRTERALAKITRRLGESERKIYLLDQLINDRGILIDVPLALKAKEIVVEGVERANLALVELTGGAVSAVTQRGKIVEWLNQNGVETNTIKKAAVTEMLESDLAPEVRAVLEARSDAGRSSVGKIDTMLEVMDPQDRRARGLMLYYGANTGRWAGRLIQPHNFPRGDVDDVEQYISYIMEGRYDDLDILHPPLAVVSSLLRGMLVASPGNRLLAADFTAIEARVLNWLAGQDDVVARFAANIDVYKENAMRIFKIPMEEVKKMPHRQTGKFQELGCGFGMGPRKALTAAKDVYGVDLIAMYGEEEAKALAVAIVKGYRDTHSEVVDYWYNLDRAAFNAVKEPGKVFEAGPGDHRNVKFVVRGAYLWLILPNKRPLCYASPRIELCEMPWGPVDEDGNILIDPISNKPMYEIREAVTSWCINGMTRKWQKRKMYGGLWSENVTQAMARDLMAEGMIRVEAAGYPVILTVHDEVVADVPNGHGSVTEYEHLMSLTPAWAHGCPVAAEAWEGQRYKK